MSTIIEIQGLGKKYKLAEAQRYLALRDIISNAGKQLFSKGKKEKEFWALQDINLAIQSGDRVGIIGRNGAGKSTLLKILSKITPPTTGNITLRGRVASLLEVGTGFHPELTGRENIFLNGAILGLSKKEIRQKLDEIIDFSGVENFIDMQLKHYSSGMQLRLAFSVAAHLEPEIMLIDEVLAVGDAEFQKKCLGKMEEVSKSRGRTILFVSHNMSYISGLCNKAILLDEGKLIKTGKIIEVINEYISKITSLTANNEAGKNFAGNEIVRLTGIKIVDNNCNRKDSFSVNEKMGIEMQYEVKEAGHVLWLGYNIHNNEGINVFDTHSVRNELYKIPHE
ncbi:MAG TPA: polysaccharide ABC transporter ATP-binding protein, partial [Chitinophagaceae bacterium]